LYSMWSFKSKAAGLRFSQVLPSTPDTFLGYYSPAHQVRSGFGYSVIARTTVMLWTDIIAEDDYCTIYRTKGTCVTPRCRTLEI
jgi:hypothetical protein